MRSSLVAAVMAATFILPTAAYAAPSGPGVYGPQLPPEQRFDVDLTVPSGAEAAALAQLLPDWDEKLEAGATEK